MDSELRYQWKLATMGQLLNFEYRDSWKDVAIAPGLLGEKGSAPATGVLDALGHPETPFLAGDFRAGRLGSSLLESKLGFVAIPLRHYQPYLILRSLSGRGTLAKAHSAFRTVQNFAVSEELSDTFEGFRPRHYQRSEGMTLSPLLTKVLVDRLSNQDIEFVHDWMIIYTRPRMLADAASVRQMTDSVRAVHRASRYAAVA